MGVILERKKRILLNEPHLVTTTPAGVANFSTDLIAPLKSCKVEFSPVQAGTGDPSPENVRPIRGWTGCTVYQSEYSMLDSTVRNQYSDQLLGLGGGYATYRVSLTAGTPYTFSIGYNSSVGYGIYIRGETGDTHVRIIESQTLVSPYVETCTFQVDKSEKYRIWAYKGDGAINSNVAWFTLVSGSTPLLPTIIHATWSSSGTVYGGYVDLVSGELAAEWVEENLETKNWKTRYSGNINKTLSTNLSGSYGFTTINPLMAEEFTINGVVGGVNSLSDPDNVSAGLRWYRNASDVNPTVIYAVCDKNYSPHGKIVYRLATPITYQLTPTQLKSLRGVNNIWSDANGDTTVKYWTH